MRVPIYHFEQHYRNNEIVHDIIASHYGYIEIDTFDHDKIWDICNWSHWTDKKPKNLYSNICSCSHGLCLINPETKDRYLALSNGWLIGNEKTISDYVFNHRYDIIWQ